MSTVQVMLGERSYPIRIRPGSLADLGEALVAEFEATRAVVVTSKRVAVRHFGALATGLARAHVELERLLVPDGERAKTLRVAASLYDRLVELGVTRQTLLIGLGGGATCDLAGFVASTYLRGLPLVQVPTTLLAQVDASVGGKTAVNHPAGKNLIGTFYQPRLVWVDPDVLATLSPRERRAGLAEVVKVAAIWDADFFKWLEDNVEAMLRLERAALSHAVARACGIKAEVVGLDERDAGLRALLNFGHTLGHAVEVVNGYRHVRHGEAVALGMVFAARLSERRGLAPAGTAERLEALVRRVGLATEITDLNAQRAAYLRAIAVDKKGADGAIGFVALREIGRAELARLTPDEILSGAT
jgi:3-dehydroquinate synthase